MLSLKLLAPQSECSSPPCCSIKRAYSSLTLSLPPSRQFSSLQSRSSWPSSALLMISAPQFFFALLRSSFSSFPSAPHSCPHNLLRNSSLPLFRPLAPLLLSLLITLASLSPKNPRYLTLSPPSFSSLSASVHAARRRRYFGPEGTHSFIVDAPSSGPQSTHRPPEWTFEWRAR